MIESRPILWIKFICAINNQLDHPSISAIHANLNQSDLFPSGQNQIDQPAAFSALGRSPGHHHEVCLNGPSRKEHSFRVLLLQNEWYPSRKGSLRGV
jgi:hypothetical protein